MDLRVPLGLALVAFGLPTLYVGWSQYCERGVPREFLRHPVLVLLFTQEWLPPLMRSREWFEGGIQVVVGSAFALGGGYLIVTGFAGAVG
jgi:hypothetical protein